MTQPKQQQKKVTSAAEWKTKSQGNPLDLPSGNVCLVRVVGPQAFLAAGTIPNALLPVVTDALERAKKGKAPSKPDIDKVVADLAEDPEKLSQIFDMADAVTVMTVVEPRVSPIPPPDEDGGPGVRDPELLYVDEVDIEDKMFIMQFAMGGSRDVERFRQEFASDVAAVLPSEDVDSPPEPTARSRRK